MGRTYWFECSKCGYRAKVAGRADRGLHMFVQTIICKDCRKLYDAVLRLRVPDEQDENRAELRKPSNTGLLQSPAGPPTFESALNLLLYKGVPKQRWLKFNPQCPIAKWHKTKEWTDPGECPRCGLYLEKNPLAYRIWD
jgi:hypothetical protein